MRQAILCLLFSAVMFSGNARAIDPGTAGGTLTVGADTVKLSYSYAHLHDNAEGWLDKPKELRILLADREVPLESLAGLNPFMTLSEMVRQNKIRGVLLRLDPANPNAIVATVLYPPKNPQESLANETLTDTSKSQFDKLQVSPQRVSGAIAHHTEGNKDFDWPTVDYKADFSAPLFNEPAVTASLTGKQALDSAQVKAVLGKAKALAKGDLKAAQQYSTKRSNIEMEAFMAQAGGEATKMAKQMGAEMERELKKGKLKLVVRGSSAALLVGEKGGKSLIHLVLEGDSWKTD
jgi:hypothetical protein